MASREHSLKPCRFQKSDPLHQGARVRGFTRLELLLMIGMLIIVAIILILPAIPHNHRRRPHCITNLKQLALAEILRINDAENDRPSWATSTNRGGSLEHRESHEVWRHFQMISNEINIPKALHCPSDKERKPANDWAKLSNGNLSYFVNVDAEWSTNQEIASTTIFFGDRLIDKKQAQQGHMLRITAKDTVFWKTNIHQQRGCVALSDGSVQWLTTTGLQALISAGESYGTAPALLALP